MTGPSARRRLGDLTPEDLAGAHQQMLADALDAVRYVRSVATDPEMPSLVRWRAREILVAHGLPLPEALN